MTEEEHILLNELKTNTAQLFREFRRLEKEKIQLEERLVEQKMEMVRLKQEKDEIGRKNENLKMANRILSGNDERNEAGKRINKIIREIDKCVALLNR